MKRKGSSLGKIPSMIGVKLSGKIRFDSGVSREAIVYIMPTRRPTSPPH